MTGSKTPTDGVCLSKGPVAGDLDWSDNAGGDFTLLHYWGGDIVLYDLALNLLSKPFK